MVHPLPNGTDDLAILRATIPYGFRLDPVLGIARETDRNLGVGSGHRLTLMDFLSLVMVYSTVILYRQEKNRTVLS